MRFTLVDHAKGQVRLNRLKSPVFKLNRLEKLSQRLKFF